MKKQRIYYRKQDFLFDLSNQRKEKYLPDDWTWNGGQGNTDFNCPTHGKFKLNPTKFSRYDHPCPACWYENRTKKTLHSRTQKFINDSRLLHGDKYDYSQVEYTNARTPVNIICPIHGLFKQNPYWHSHEGGCPKCTKEKT